MSFGISLSTSPSASALGDADALSYVTERAREAEAAGVDDIWLNQGLDIDSVTVAALVAQAVPRIIVGTAVVPMYPRHPVVLASQAKAAQLAARGRFALGIGLGHQGQVEGVFGVPFDRPIGHLRDYLLALRSLLDTGTAAVRGPTLTADLSGVPGRPAPRIAAGVPASVTSDPQRARARAFEALGGYARNVSYAAVLEREGISHAADLALVGDEETVAAGIRRYLDAGATDVRVSPVAFATDEERLRTWRLVGELARSSSVGDHLGLAPLGRPDEAGSIGERAARPAS